MTLRELMRLDGKTALVAGGAGLLGSEIAHGLAELGANVVVASRDLEACRRKCSELEGSYAGIKAHALQLDLTNRASVIQCVDRAVAEHGGFDILVVCAWSGRKNSWESINDEDWENDIEVCLNGVFRLIKAATGNLKEKKGVVLTIGSMYGHVAPDHHLYMGVPQTNPPSYGAAKAGVIQLTRYLACFLAPHGIRVNCISPGPFPYASVIDQYPVFRDRLSSKNPLGRLGKPHEIKGAAALLCSDASRYITGQNFCVDGGWGVW